MQNPRIVSDELGSWREAALRDRAMVDSLFSQKFFEGAAFHAQQAAEKMLKATLAARNAWSRTHSCTEMLVILRQQGLQVEEGLFRDARLVDRAYIDARYPREADATSGPSNLYDEGTALEVVQTCDRLMTWARSVPPSSGSSPA